MADVKDVELQEGLARSVRKYRRQRGLSQAGLAERLGLSRTTITNVERGTQGVTLLTFVHLAGQLGISAADLLREITEPDALVAAGSTERTAIAEAPGAYREWVASLAATPDDGIARRTRPTGSGDTP
jgi:transcriptional regulator with XRE-family HTH domain